MAGKQRFRADLDADSLLYSRYERTYLVLACSFVTVLVLTNLIGIKLFRSPLDPSFALTTGILTYPLTFLLTDAVSEIYGKRRADFMVIVGFLMSLLMLAVVQLSVAVDPHPYWVGAFYADGCSTGTEVTTPSALDCYQHAWESVFNLQGVLLVGSMLAYLCAQLTDNALFHFWKRLTAGKHLWLRNNGSTWVSQLVDTAIVNSILFYVGFGMELWVGVSIMVTIYWHKLILAALDTPLLYALVAFLRWFLADELRAQETGTQSP